MANKGIARCVEAFERIKNNEPTVLRFKDIPAKDITPSIVSQEAGFSSGYLKRNRESHAPLITLIDDFASKGNSSSLSANEALKRAENKRKNEKTEKLEALKLRDQALARELILVKKLREVEKSLLQYQTDKVISLR